MPVLGGTCLEKGRTARAIYSHITAAHERQAAEVLQQAVAG
jgi:hypothetical protein